MKHEGPKRQAEIMESIKESAGLVRDVWFIARQMGVRGLLRSLTSTSPEQYVNDKNRVRREGAVFPVTESTRLAFSRGGRG